jgi:hypothetical protein
MNIDTLEAGRELDALVAEKVMGWTWPDDRCPICGWSFSDTAAEGCVPGDCSQRPIPTVPESEDYPHYSTDITAAWEVVEKMLGQLPQQDIHFQHLEYTGWGVGTCFNKEEGGWDEWMYGETLPIAICRAALKAVEAQ